MEESLATLRPGSCVWCRVEAAEPGGYEVSVTGKRIKGFLPATDPIPIGKELPATFVCVSGERALFTFAFTMGTSAKVQHSKESDQVIAFSVWTDAYPKSYSLRRAVDLVMPSVESTPLLLKLNENTAAEFFPNLEETSFTGCMKIYCESSLSRSALLLHRGRAVGSIYTRKPMSEPYPFELGINNLLEDVSAPGADADVEMYELPEEFVLSMSALFLGYIDRPEAAANKLEYTEKMLQHLKSMKETACFHMFDLRTNTTAVLGFVFKGEYTGTYAIAERVLNPGEESLLELAEKSDHLRMQTHLLPSAMVTDAVRFGYSLRTKQFDAKK